MDLATHLVAHISNVIDFYLTLLLTSIKMSFGLKREQIISISLDFLTC